MGRKSDRPAGNWVFDMGPRQYIGSNRQRRRHPEQYGEYIEKRQRADHDYKELPEMRRAREDQERTTRENV